MNSFSNRAVTTLTVVFVACCSVLAFSDEPRDISQPTFHAEQSEKLELAGIKTLQVGSYNLLNLFEKKGKIHEGKSPLFHLIPEGRRPLEEALKTLEDLKAQAQIILNNKYDVLAVSEVENLEALRALSIEFLGGKYDSYLIEGNDPRGIDVGFLVKSSLPFHIEQRTHKFETWEDPTQGGKKSRVFSRDLPALLFRTKKNESPVMVYFGTHFKSKRDRAHDPESRLLRKAQVERASLIIKAYEKEFGTETPIFLAGDFNGEIKEEKEFSALRQVAELEDTFDVVNPPLSKKERITHSYFPKDGNPKWAQLDAVMVNLMGTQFVTEAKVPHYHDENGNEIPIPESFDELKKTQPSDHYPVHVELDMSQLLK